jgi:Zn-dependent alcohol dehydrogenase
MRFTAAILPGPGEPIVLDEIEVSEPAPREVLVRLHAAGICRSQLTQLHTPKAVPMLLGHEAAGEVLAVGGSVTRVRRGDRVLLAAVPTTPEGEEYPVGTTWRWRGEEYAGAHTDNVNVFAWATHTQVDERNLTPVPADFPTDVASILGCAGVTGCGSVVNVANVEPGASAVVWGVGGVGLCAVIACAAVGADPVVAVDLDDERLALARDLGATAGVNAMENDPVEAVVELTGGGADYVFDTVGTTDQALRATRAGIPGRSRGGMAVSIGRPTSPPNLKELLCMGRTYAHSSAGDGRPTRDLPRYVEWYREGRFPLERLVTRRYRLEEINDATRDLEKDRILGRAIVVYDAVNPS